MNKNLVIELPGNEEEISALSSELGIERPLAQMLTQRNIKTYQEAKDYFRPDLANLHDPFLMKDMDKAIERIHWYPGRRKMLIDGDYDVDGTTAVALVLFLVSRVILRIWTNHRSRYDEGYGISIEGIDYADQHRISLVIALDCGIKAVEKIEYARKKGIDFIICVIITPAKRSRMQWLCWTQSREVVPYPYKELSGCGVGLKLVQAFGIKNGEGSR